MTELNRIDGTQTDPMAWKPGDVVMAVNGGIWVRSDHPRWVWDYPSEAMSMPAPGRPHVPEGAVEEHDPLVHRPLLLLIRDGRPVQTIVMHATAQPAVESREE
ncbi:hypothetical protein ACFXKG_18995 [Streptomyces sp. NPDC059255]|uniref:hypothetical protein n=1 Tax=Streptomyces sp. NPDC059255 TaxID=3346793 RepID=UPI0036B6A27A